MSVYVIKSFLIYIIYNVHCTCLSFSQLLISIHYICSYVHMYCNVLHACALIMLSIGTCALMFYLFFSTAMEMFQPLRRELLSLEEGVVMRDQSLGKDVLVVAPVLLAKCDNPRAAEPLGHMGAQAKKFCKVCMVCLCTCMSMHASIYLHILCTHAH